MPELVFVVEVASECGFTVRSLGVSIFAEANTEAELRTATQDVVQGHFNGANLPKVVRLHFVRGDLMTACRRSGSKTLV